MKLIEESVSAFTDLLASPASVPGGGGASALVGAIGIALGDMTGELTVGKKKYAEVEDEIKECMKKAKDLKDKLLDCVDGDAVAFEPLAKAYGIPKEDPSRDEIMEKCLRNAAKVPFDILRYSCEALELLKIFAAKGSKLVTSDSATGAAVCRAALMGAAVNVKINTKLMKDREYAGNINAEVDRLVGTYTKLADEIFDMIYGTY